MFNFGTSELILVAVVFALVFLFVGLIIFALFKIAKKKQ